MTNSEDKKSLKFTPNKEYILFGLSVFVILFVIFKFSLLFYYIQQSEKTFNTNSECNTYKTIYVSELKNGNENNISILIKEAKNENCLTVSDKKEKNKNQIEKKEKNEKVYNSVDVHEANN